MLQRCICRRRSLLSWHWLQKTAPVSRKSSRARKRSVPPHFGQGWCRPSRSSAGMPASVGRISGQCPTAARLIWATSAAGLVLVAVVLICRSFSSFTNHLLDGCPFHCVPFNRARLVRHAAHVGPSRRTCKNPRVPIGWAVSVITQTTAAGSIGAESRQPEAGGIPGNGGRGSRGLAGSYSSRGLPAIEPATTDKRSRLSRKRSIVGRSQCRRQAAYSLHKTATSEPPCGDNALMKCSASLWACCHLWESFSLLPMAMSGN